MQFYKMTFKDYESTSELIFMHDNLFTHEEWHQIANEALRAGYQEYMKSDEHARRVKYVMEHRERVKAQIQELTDGTWQDSWESAMTEPIDINIAYLDMAAITSSIEARGFLSVNGREAASVVIDGDMSLNYGQFDDEDMSDTAQLFRFINK